MGDNVIEDVAAGGGADDLVEQVGGARAPRTAVKNWALDPRVVERIRAEVVPLVEETKARKAPLNAKWASLEKVWHLEPEGESYNGRSKLYIPAGHRGIETMVAHLVAVTFPSPQPFTARARVPEAEPFVEPAARLLAYRLRQAKLRLKAEAFYRQLLIKGTSTVKVRHVKRTTRAGGFGPDNLYPAAASGPVFEPFDAADYYVYPESATEPSDIVLEFEELSVSAGLLRQRARAGVYAPEAVEAAVMGSESHEFTQHRDAALANQGFSGLDVPDVKPVHIQEVYMQFDPEAASLGEEENPLPFLITLSASGEVLRAVVNPSWDRESPYLVARIGAMVGRFYGHGPLQGVQQLNRLLNDQTNQTVDCSTYAMNPLAMVNRNLMDGLPGAIEPGKTWYVHDVNQAVRFQVPPMEPVNVGAAMIAQTANWVQEYLGAPPVLSGGSAPGRAFRSATGVSTAQTNAQVPLANIVAHCEEAVWTPLLSKFWALDQQCTDEDVLVPLTGSSEFKRINPQELPGEYLFEWEASAHFEKSQLRATQLTQALGMITQEPVVAAMAQNGKRINPEPIIRQLLGDVFGLRAVDDVIVNAPPPPPPGMPPEAGMPPPGAAPGETPAEAPDGELEGESEMLDDNDEFANTRVDANQLAAILGGGDGL